MGVAIAGAVAGLASAGVSAYSAYSASKDRKKAMQQAEDQQSAYADQLGLSEEALQALFENQQSPFEIFSEILTGLPGLLDQVLPDLRRQSTETATQFTQNNIDNRDAAIKRMFPEYNRLKDSLVGVIDQMNPDNLGAEELRGITKLLGGIIPADTLDPNTGAVAGGVTTPVALYRNLISGAYQQRRQDYGNALTAYLGNAENSAVRQQERASAFLGQYLSLAGNAAGALTQQTIGQQNNQIAAQSGFVNTLLGMAPTAPDLSGFNAAIANGINGIASGLGTAVNSFKTNPQPAIQTAQPTTGKTNATNVKGLI